MPSAEDLITALRLQPHPEGGAFAETYRHADQLPVRGGRATATGIYFLLRSGQRSAWHRVASDELWLYHGGDPLTLEQVTPDGQPTDQVLGLDVLAGQRPQALVPAGHWQATAPQAGPIGWTLVGCVVAPGFDFADFELADDAAIAELTGRPSRPAS